DLRGLVREIPHFLRLLWGLARDPRVSKADKAIVVGAIAYAALPADLIPDWIPGLGEIEDVFLVAMALSRLLSHAGEEVLMDHWEGDEETLEAAMGALDGATQFLPSSIRGLLTGRR
ncbi:MAG TPA: YkvA family protein, partial [Longimicrobium sp.]|nr:YkvA family protein [Longimicrobium sp.]